MNLKKQLKIKTRHVWNALKPRADTAFSPNSRCESQFERSKPQKIVIWTLKPHFEQFERAQDAFFTVFSWFVWLKLYRTENQPGTGTTGDTFLPLTLVPLSPALQFKILGCP